MDATDELPTGRTVAYTNEFLDGYGSSRHGFAEGHASVDVKRSSEVMFSNPGFASPRPNRERYRNLNLEESKLERSHRRNHA